MVDTPALGSSLWSADADEARGSTVCDALYQAAATVPDRRTPVDCPLERATHRERTYTEFVADAERAVRALLAKFAPSDRIAAWTPNKFGSPDQHYE